MENLAIVYLSNSEYANAEKMFQAAIAIREEVLGPDDPTVAMTLERLANVYNDEGRSAEALSASLS